MGCGGSKEVAENNIAPEAQIIKDDTKEGEFAAPVSHTFDIEFEVEVEREYDEPLGVMISKNTLRILVVRAEGLLPAWIDRQFESSVPQTGDYIVEVNGVNTDAEKMMQQILDPGSLTLRFQRFLNVPMKSAPPSSKFGSSCFGYDV